MREMIIRSGGETNQQIPYAVGRFAEDGNAYLVNQIIGMSPFGSVLCGLNSDYAMEMLPDGSSRTWYAGFDIAPPNGMGKACYLKDKETGDIWSAFYGPICKKSDDYEVTYSPGQISVYSLKNKIASTLTITTLPNSSCEVWRVKLENRSAQSREIAFTTYFEPWIASTLEAKYRDHEKTLLMRPPLESVAMDHVGKTSENLVLFHSSTLTPTRFSISKMDFIGDGRTLFNPEHVENDESVSSDGVTNNAVASFTVEVGLPIEGEAEFGFCLGVASSAEAALSIANSFTKVEAINSAIEASSQQWDSLCSTLNVSTPDKAFDALVNKWLPYEIYSEWIKERNNPLYLDPSKVADLLRRLYPFTAAAPSLCRETLLSFAAGLSIMGSYSPDDNSIVCLSPTELLWLAISTARYVAETGDLSVLSESIPLRGGLSLTLREHCERAIRTCLNSNQSSLSDRDEYFLEQTIKLWPLVNEDFRALEPYLSRRKADRNEYPEQRTLPRRVRYFQSISPTLKEKQVLQDIHAYVDSNEDANGDVGTACQLYLTLIEQILGLSPTYEGLMLNPKLPDHWNECEINRRFRGDTYNIYIRRSATPIGAGKSIVVDGEPIFGDMLPYSGDGCAHRVDVVVS